MNTLAGLMATSNLEYEIIIVLSACASPEIEHVITSDE